MDQTKEIDRLRKLIGDAANYLETAADIIADGIDHDEDDDAMTRDFIDELRLEAAKATEA